MPPVCVVWGTHMKEKVLTRGRGTIGSVGGGELGSVGGGGLGSVGGRGTRERARVRARVRVSMRFLNWHNL